MAGHYTVTVGGTEYPTASGQYERGYQIKAYPFKVTIPIKASFLSQGTVIIQRDSDTVFLGKIQTITESASGEVPQTILEGSSLARKAGLIPVMNREVNSRPGTQLIDNLPDSELSQGTINDYGSNLHMEYGSSEDQRFSRLRAFNDICAVTGWEIDIQPSGTVDLKSQCGTDRSSSVIFARGALIKSWITPYQTLSTSDIKRVVVVGQSQGSYLVGGTAGAGDYSAGDPTRQFSQKALIDANMCGTMAQTIYDDTQNNVKKVEFEATDTFEGKAFDVFDTVTYQDDILEKDEPLRIFRLEKRWGGNAEKTILGLTNVTHLCANGQMLLNRGESILDAILGAAQDFSLTNQPVGVNEIVTTIGTRGGAREVVDPTNAEYSTTNGTYGTDVFHSFPQPPIAGAKNLVRYAYAKVKVAPPALGGTALVAFDCYVDQSAPTTNYNTNPLKVRTINSAFILFPLTEFKDSSAITSASLNLYNNSVVAGDTLDAERLTDVGWAETDPTWNNQPASTATNKASQTMVASDWNTWTITDMLKDALDAGQNCLGVVIKGTATLAYQFSDRTQGSLAPYLLISYSSPTTSYKVTYSIDGAAELEYFSGTTTSESYVEVDHTADVATALNQSLQLFWYIKVNVGTTYLQHPYAQFDVHAYREDLG